MSILKDIKSILDTPAQTLKATELLTTIMTGRVLPGKEPDKEATDAKNQSQISN